MPDAFGRQLHRRDAKSAESLSDLEAFAWPTPDGRDYSDLKRQAQEHEEFALVYGFADVWQRPALVRGWEGMLL